MKTTCLALIIGCAVVHGSGYATQSNAEQTSSGLPKAASDHAGNADLNDAAATRADAANSNTPQDARRPADAGRVHNRVRVSIVNRPQRLPKRETTISEKASAPRPPLARALDKEAEGLFEDSALPIRPPNVASRRGVPAIPAIALRHGGANPPTITGSANAKTRSTGEINGTHMRRRP